MIAGRNLVITPMHFAYKYFDRRQTKCLSLKYSSAKITVRSKTTHSDDHKVS